MKALAFIAALLLASSVGAEYGSTTWGMSLPELAKVYPGGELVRLENGWHEYRAVLPIGPVSTGFVTFEGGWDQKLLLVQVLFPVQGSAVDLKKRSYQVPTQEEADSIFALLRDALVRKYGKPAFAKEEAHHKSVVWQQPNETIGLMQLRNDSLGHSRVSLRYDPHPAVLERFSSEKTKPR